MRKVALRRTENGRRGNRQWWRDKGVTLNVLTGVERVFYSMRDAQVARLGQFDRPAHHFCGDPRAIRLWHASRRDRCLHRIGRGFSGTAATELTAAVKR